MLRIGCITSEERAGHGCVALSRESVDVDAQHRTERIPHRVMNSARIEPISLEVFVGFLETTCLANC